MQSFYLGRSAGSRDGLRQNEDEKAASYSNGGGSGMMIELKQGFIMGTSTIGGDSNKAKVTRGG